MKQGFYTDLSNKEYHAETGFLSSSMLKLILDSPEMYYKKYILKEVSEKHNDAFDVGTAIHTRILEPETYAGTITSFSGVRRGKRWDEFSALHKDKIILGDLQVMQVDKMYEAFLKSELGPALIKDGIPEYSLFTQLNGKPVKVRADYFKLSKDKCKITIFDVKSTTGAIDANSFLKGAESKRLSYDLQSAFYVDAYDKNVMRYISEKGTTEVEFVWIVISKDIGDIKFFKATPELLEQGREKYKRAMKLIDKYNELGWDFKQEIIDLYPTTYGGF